MLLAQLCQAWFAVQFPNRGELRSVPTYNAQMGDAAASTEDYLQDQKAACFDDLPIQDQALVQARVLAVLNGDVPRQRLEGGDRAIWAGRCRGVDPSVQGFTVFYDSVFISPGWTCTPAFCQPSNIGKLPRCNLEVPGTLRLPGEPALWLTQIDARTHLDAILTPKSARLALMLLENTTFEIYISHRRVAEGKLIELYQAPRPLNVAFLPRELFEVRIGHNGDGGEVLQTYGSPTTVTITVAGLRAETPEQLSVLTTLRGRSSRTRE